MHVVVEINVKFEHFLIH